MERAGRWSGRAVKGQAVGKKGTQGRQEKLKGIKAANLERTEGQAHVANQASKKVKGEAEGAVVWHQEADANRGPVGKGKHVLHVKGQRKGKCNSSGDQGGIAVEEKVMWAEGGGERRTRRRRGPDNPPERT